MINNIKSVDHWGNELHVPETAKGGFYRSEKFGVVHYYAIRDNDVLHIGDALINTIDAIRINDRQSLTRITKSEFENALRDTLFQMSIHEYAISK